MTLFIFGKMHCEFDEGSYRQSVLAISNVKILSMPLAKLLNGAPAATGKL